MTASSGRKPAGLRVVLDTNVALSAMLFRGGPLSALRTAWQSGAFVPVVSRPTLEELTRVLAYPKFGLNASEITTALAMCLPYVQAHKTAHPPDLASRALLCRDPKDQMFLELAQSAQVDCLVTGDDDLLVLAPTAQQLGGFRIVKPLEFMAGLPSAREK